MIKKMILRCSQEVNELLQTLCDISSITRALSWRRSDTMILRLHNSAYKHAILVKNFLEPNLSSCYQKVNNQVCFKCDQIPPFFFFFHLGICFFFKTYQRLNEWTWFQRENINNQLPSTCVNTYLCVHIMWLYYFYCK